MYLVGVRSYMHALRFNEGFGPAAGAGSLTVATGTKESRPRRGRLSRFGRADARLIPITYAFLRRSARPAMPSMSRIPLVGSGTSEVAQLPASADDERLKE